ncbi:uncharacterized protein LOC113314404 [Papaver somniferum]|uniref:uncharacterized protein LOC113314404 n=1 Tax=Papaver somniferum TaxID=3469 RepID=UPI000E6F577A|nr:uncharacterized protein LOC113314404 [Papaver somniferum]
MMLQCKFFLHQDEISIIHFDKERSLSDSIVDDAAAAPFLAGVKQYQGITSVGHGIVPTSIGKWQPPWSGPVEKALVLVVNVVLAASLEWTGGEGFGLDSIRLFVLGPEPGIKPS